uniref:Putative secreted protein n=1 Tax=Anopheles marajoara TaxID=58244 RepID=A0A2M4C8J6_9DIPT
MSLVVVSNICIWLTLHCRPVLHHEPNCSSSSNATLLAPRGTPGLGNQQLDQTGIPSRCSTRQNAPGSLNGCLWRKGEYCWWNLVKADRGILHVFLLRFFFVLIF